MRPSTPYPGNRVVWGADPTPCTYCGHLIRWTEWRPFDSVGAAVGAGWVNTAVCCKQWRKTKTATWYYNFSKRTTPTKNTTERTHG